MIAAAIVAVAMAASSTLAAATATPTSESHCVVEVVGIDRDGVFVTAGEVCFATETEAHATASRSSGTTMGRHYTSTGFGGSSVTIAGTT